MAGNDGQRDGEAASGSGDPGPLSRLLQELADASSGDVLEDWKHEVSPGDRLGRFEIRREVGRGGFGAVYEAFDTELNRVVAVKTLRLSRPRRDLSSDWIKKEAEAVARLDHPCIVTLHDVGTCDSGPYLVMELLRGKTLAQRIAEGPVPLAEALHIAEEMAKGLAHAHQRGVLHRDLKPANVFLCEDGRVKLLDFGLAHLLGTEGVSGAGTPKYMAPEQARGEAVDQRADVYAAGRVLGEMIGEQRPRRLEHAIVLATSTDPATRPRDGQAWLDILQTVRRGMERPAQLRRVAVLAGLGVIVGGVVVGVAVHRASQPAAEVRANPSIAVLPFSDMSPTRDQEYFADGVAEEILTSLTRVKGLKVIGRTSSFSFKGKPDDIQAIGRKLNVHAILEGSVRKQGPKLRITANMVRVEDGSQIWTKTFDGDQARVFAVQEEVARSVAEALRVKLLPGEDLAERWVRTREPEAYNQLLLGRQFMRQGTLDDLQRARAAFEKAAAIDPGYAAAWTGVSRAIIAILSWDRDDPELRRKALAAADRAVALAPDVPNGYITRSWARRKLLFDWAGALADLDTAARLGPGDEEIDALRAELRGAPEPAAEAIRRAQSDVERDPLNPEAWMWLGVAYVAGENYARAGQALARALEIAPGHVGASWNECVRLVAGGHPGEALALAQRSSIEWLQLTCTALAQHDLGRAKESKAALDALVERWADGFALQVAEVHAWRGDPDRAFEWLERAYTQRDSGMLWLQTDPFLRKLHGDRRWMPFLRKMTLPGD